MYASRLVIIVAVKFIKVGYLMNNVFKCNI